MKNIINYIKVVLGIYLALFCVDSANSQMTIQIGTGNDAPGSGTQYSPMYRFSAGSATTNSRSDILFSQSEMAAAGIPAGATIIAIQFNKQNANNFLIPTSFSMFMNNSSNSALDPNIITWANIQNTFTSVYNNAAFNLPNTSGWVTWNLQTPFIYTGGALEIATENNMTGGATGATGNLAWEWTASTPISMAIGAPNAMAFSAGQTPYRARPNIKITYYPPLSTTQIGTGNDAPGSGTQYSPMYRFSAGSATTNSRSDILFSQSEMAAAGIPAGATITGIQFNKQNANNFLIPTSFSMLMNNSSKSALDPNIITWANIQNTFTSVYNNAAFNLPNTPGWVTWNLQTPFVYTGGALEIATENNMTGGATGATGNLAWEWTASTDVSMAIGAPNAMAFSAGQTPYRARPNIKFTYYAPACSRPSSLLVKNITNITANASWDPISGATGYQYAITNSSTPPASGTDIVTNSVDITGLNPVTQYYMHVRTNCGTGYSLFWATTSFSTLEPCPKPSIPVIVTNNTDGIATISWDPSPFGAFGYEYAVTKEAAPPSSGTATTLTSIKAADLTGAARYYAHVRANCNGQGYSSWVSKEFITPCFIPAPTISSNIKPGVLDFTWHNTGGSLKYEYAITNTPAYPASGSSTSDTAYHTSMSTDGITYYFHVRSHCGTAVSSWATLPFNTLGLEAFPNPVKATLNVRINGVNNPSGQITIGDAMGRIVAKLQMYGTSTSVDTRGWSAGIYIIRYDDGKNNFSIRVIKQ